MRWIDIILPEPDNHPVLDGHLASAARFAAEIPVLQEEHGLDSIKVIELMTKAGQELFQGVTAANPGAFSPNWDTDSFRPPSLGQKEHDTLVGYHIVAGETWVGLPWTWLHNGVGFLFEKHPICAGIFGSRLPEGSNHRPWMQRLTRAQFLVGENGGSNLREILSQLRPGDEVLPEVLFVPGHTDSERRKLIYREAELIDGALEHRCQGETLIKLDLPLTAVTPSDLVRKGLQYQAIHFAGPTSHSAQPEDTFGEYWMDSLIEEAPEELSRELDDAMGIEGEVLGVDPVTSLLDDIAERYETAGSTPEQVAVPVGSTASASGSGISNESTRNIPTPSKSWLLDDGPVHPENMERAGVLPPLIFSNSYQALPALGNRFVRAGSSTFIGPVVPLFSRPARIFAGHCYAAMGQGWSAGASVWKAAQECRHQLGAEHPAWLSYGIQGHGALALQYL